MILYRSIAAEGKVPKVKYKCQGQLQLYGGGFRLFKKNDSFLSIYLSLCPAPQAREVAKRMSKEIRKLKNKTKQRRLWK